MGARVCMCLPASRKQVTQLADHLYSTATTTSTLNAVIYELQGFTCCLLDESLSIRKSSTLAGNPVCLSGQPAIQQPS